MDTIPLIPANISLRNLPPERARFANAFIEAVHKMDLPEKKLLAHITRKMQQHGQTVVKISPAEMLEWSGAGGHNYSYAKEKLLHLQEKGILVFEELIYTESNSPRKKFKSFSFLQEIEYTEREGAEIKLTDALSNFIIGVKEKYTEVYLSCVCKFSSKYSLRLYELCKQYLNIGKRSFVVTELVNLLDAPASYTKPAYLINKALTPGMNDINTHSDIIVKISKKHLTKTKGKSFVEFTISPNPGFKPYLKSEEQPALPGIDTGDAEKNKLELDLRLKGVKGDVAKLIKSAGGHEAVHWYWKNILSKDDISKIRMKDKYLRESIIQNAAASYNLYLKGKTVRADTGFIDAETIAKERNYISQDTMERHDVFISLSPSEKKKIVEEALMNADQAIVDEIHQETIREIVKTGEINSISLDRFNTWLMPALHSDAVK